MVKLKELLLELDYENNRKFLSDYLNNTLILGGLMKDTLKHGVAQVFSIVNTKGLRGYTPIASYGKIIDESEFNSDLKRLRDYTTFFIAWLLMKKDNDYFIDVVDMREKERHYFYGVRANLKKWEQTSLPSDVFDFFRDIVNKGKDNVSYVDYLRGIRNA